MVAAVVKASAVGAWAGSLSFSTPSCRTSRCSTWVSQLNPGFARSRVDNVARQRQSLAFSEPGLSGSFRGGRVDWKVESPERRFRTGLVRASGLQDDASGSGADALEGIDLDPGVFKEQSFQKVKAQYAEPVNPDDFKDAHELMAAYEGQKVLGKLVHERMELKELKAKGGPVQLWNWMKSAQGMLGAVALTVVMLMHMPGPPKPPVVRDVLPHRRSINAAAPRRGRGAALRGTPRSEHVSPVEFLPQAIAACSVIAMVTHLLQKNACEQTPMLVQKEPKTDTGMTVFHLHLGISGFACSLRYDLDDINGNELDVLGRVERPQSLKTIARVLSRHLEHIVYAGNQIQHTMHPTTWPTFLNNWEYADASHIRLAPTKETLKKIGKDYGRPMKEDDRMLMDSYKAGYTAVTLSGAVRGRLPLPPVTNSLNLHVLLASLEVLDPARVETLKLSWTPTTGETLPEETMLAYFPHMTLLAEPVEVL